MSVDFVISKEEVKGKISLEKLYLLKKKISFFLKEKRDKELIKAYYEELEKIRRQNKKRWFFKKPETIEYAKESCLSAFNIEDCYRIIDEKNIHKIEKVIERVEKDNKINNDDLNFFFSFCKALNIFNKEEFEEFIFV